jgi:UDP-N-acetylglucosamine 2-epimerase (non-hydrolysing)
MSNAKLAITDSGGIQEETTILGIPCITLRKNTERPVTTTQGTNVIVGTNPKKIVDEYLP